MGAREKLSGLKKRVKEYMDNPRGKQFNRKNIRNAVYRDNYPIDHAYWPAIYKRKRYSLHTQIKLPSNLSQSPHRPVEPSRQSVARP